MEHVAVTGMGIVSPIGSTTQSFWRRLLEGKRAIAPMPDGAHLSGNRLWAAVGDDFLETEPRCRAARYATPIASRNMRWWLRLKRSRKQNSNPPDKTGVILGNTMGGFPFVAESQTRFLDGARNVTPKLMALVIPNMAGASIAMHWKLHGPQLAISTACASSLDAIGLAAGMIERGEIEAAITGGSETLLSPIVYESLVRAGALSRNPDPRIERRGRSTSSATGS